MSYSLIVIIPNITERMIYSPFTKADHLGKKGQHTLQLMLYSCRVPVKLCSVPILQLASVVLASMLLSASLFLHTTTTACLSSRACRSAAVASLCFTFFSVCPLIDSTSSPFSMVPSRAAKPWGKIL